MLPKHIEIIKESFGAYSVKVLDKDGNLKDRKYFCHGYWSAHMTAKELKKDLFPKLPIYLREGEKVTKIK